MSGGGFFDKFIKGSGLTPMANAISMGVAFAGAAAWYWYDVTSREAKKMEFKKNEQEEWNKQVLSRQKAEDEKKKRLGMQTDDSALPPSQR